MNENYAMLEPGKTIQISIKEKLPRLTHNQANLLSIKYKRHHA